MSQVLPYFCGAGRGKRKNPLKVPVSHDLTTIGNPHFPELAGRTQIVAGSSYIFVDTIAHHVKNYSDRTKMDQSEEIQSIESKLAEAEASLESVEDERSNTRKQLRQTKSTLSIAKFSDRSRRIVERTVVSRVGGALLIVVFFGCLGMVATETFLAALAISIFLGGMVASALFVPTDQKISEILSDHPEIKEQLEESLSYFTSQQSDLEKQIKKLSKRLEILGRESSSHVPEDSEFRVNRATTPVGIQTNESSGVMVKGSIICPNPNCGYQGRPKRIARGSMLVAVLLGFFFIIPALLYMLIYSGYRYECPRCGNEIKTGSDRRII